MNLLPYKILKILLASCLATPLLAFSNVIFPYTVPKIFAFRVLVEIAAVFFIYLVLKCPKIFCHSGRPFVIPASSVILASSVIPAQVMDPDARRAGIQNPGSRIKSGMTNKKKLVAFLFLILIFILITSLFSIRNSLFVKNNPTLSRLTSISLSDSTVQSRLILWQDAWRAWQARPWLGFGPENFEAAVGPYLSPKLIGFESYAFDRAHNLIFDYGVASGWLGLVGYLVLFCAALWALWQRRADNFMFFAVFTALLTAYLVQNLFIFDSFISYLMLFFVLALINNSNQGLFFSVIPAKAGIQDYGSRIHRYSGADKCEMTTKLSVVKNLLLIFVIGNLSFVIYSYNLKPLLSANYANQILSLPASDAAQAAVLLKDALALNSFASPEIAYQAAIDYTEKINQNSVLTQNEEFYNIAADELARVIGRSPNQPRSYIALAWLDLYFSGRHSERINEAIDLGNKIIKLSPIKKDAYLILVAGDALSNQPQKAEEIISQASAIDVKMGKEVRAYLERLK